MQASVRVAVPYGREARSFNVPRVNLGDVLRPNPLALSKDGEGVIARAIENPMESPLLGHVVRGKREVVLIVDDLTRPTPVSSRTWSWREWG